MNDVLYFLYEHTGNEMHLKTARYSSLSLPCACQRLRLLLFLFAIPLAALAPHAYT